LPKEDGSISFDIIITTYNLCINKVDRVKFFKKFDFCYIVLGECSLCCSMLRLILDEAHNIKNVSSVRYQNLLKLAFRAEYRLMLTGTPLQVNGIIVQIDSEEQYK
jgi:SNF2 family DNA or RNA helicase